MLTVPRERGKQKGHQRAMMAIRIERSEELAFS